MSTNVADEEMVVAHVILVDKILKTQAKKIEAAGKKVTKVVEVAWTECKDELARLILCVISSHPRSIKSFMEEAMKKVEIKVERTWADPNLVNELI